MQMCHNQLSHVSGTCIDIMQMLCHNQLSHVSGTCIDIILVDVNMSQKCVTNNRIVGYLGKYNLSASGSERHERGGGRAFRLIWMLNNIILLNLMTNTKLEGIRHLTIGVSCMRAFGW
jgi:hypothetical protein